MLYVRVIATYSHTKQNKKEEKLFSEYGIYTLYIIQKYVSSTRAFSLSKFE